VKLGGPIFIDSWFIHRLFYRQQSLMFTLYRKSVFFGWGYFTAGACLEEKSPIPSALITQGTGHFQAGFASA
ncbi:hypothetical protein, partial [Enterocloster sp.]|uniref:hypothetical protein n=1 Tax=Enterocloster sp. TaxID=2719315 RepID=UPI002845DD15